MWPRQAPSAGSSRLGSRRRSSGHAGLRLACDGTSGLGPWTAGDRLVAGAAMQRLRHLAAGLRGRPVATAVAMFALSGLAVLLLVGLALVYVLRGVGRDQAVNESRRLTTLT